MSEFETICLICKQRIEFDEGEIDSQGGYICCNCINEEKFGDLKND